MHVAPHHYSPATLRYFASSNHKKSTPVTWQQARAIQDPFDEEDNIKTSKGTRYFLAPNYPEHLVRISAESDSRCNECTLNRTASNLEREEAQRQQEFDWLTLQQYVLLMDNLLRWMGSDLAGEARDATSSAEGTSASTVPESSAEATSAADNSASAKSSIEAISTADDFSAPESSAEAMPAAGETLPTVYLRLAKVPPDRQGLGDKGFEKIERYLPYFN